MTTPTPPPWMTCDHRDAGLPGCPTCDGTLSPEARRLLLECAQYAAGKTMDAHAAEAECARLRESVDYLISALDSGVGVGPWTRVGGPMPEPWPGCGVECDGARLLVTRVARGHGAVEWEMDTHGRIDIPSPSVTSLWDGRRCVWRRE